MQTLQATGRVELAWQTLVDLTDAAAQRAVGSVKIASRSVHARHSTGVCLGRTTLTPRFLLIPMANRKCQVTLLANAQEAADHGIPRLTSMRDSSYMYRCLTAELSCRIHRVVLYTPQKKFNVVFLAAHGLWVRLLRLQDI